MKPAQLIVDGKGDDLMRVDSVRVLKQTTKEVDLLIRHAVKTQTGFIDITHHCTPFTGNKTTTHWSITAAKHYHAQVQKEMEQRGYDTNATWKVHFLAKCSRAIRDYNS